MMNSINTLTKKQQLSLLKPTKVDRHRKLIEKNHQSNQDSNYTEKIEDIDKKFNYRGNSNHYWSEAEQSLLYGTPLYEQASAAQKIALNHLHWFANYNYVADTETETVTFNQVTSSVFDAIGGYETLLQMLDLETHQEHFHIHAFRKIGLTTANALMGKQTLQDLFKWHSYKRTLGRDRWLTSQYYALRLLTKTMLKHKEQYYSQYLRKLEEQEKFVGQIPTKGIFGREIAPSLQRFFSFNWGSGSPFLACQYYAIRMMGNMTLKNMEHRIVKYYRKLKKKGEFIPAPTSISNYHFLDESFHTTTSLLIARDMHKDFPQPTTYEKFIANLAIYMVQAGSLGSLSGAFTHRYFKDDFSLMQLIYGLLQSPLFGMSASEALDWMSQCLCHEHDGFYLAQKNHAHLLGEFRNFFEDFDYLWSVNREMRLMAAGSSIEQAINHNLKSFKSFSRLVERVR